MKLPLYASFFEKVEPINELIFVLHVTSNNTAYQRLNLKHFKISISGRAV